MVEKQRKERAALTTAFAAHIARPVSPPPSPQIVPTEYVLSSVEASVLESARAQLQPLVDEMRKNVEEMLLTQHAEVHNSLSGKMSVILRMLDSVSARVNREEGQILDDGETLSSASYPQI